MPKTKVTLAALPSLLADTAANLRLVEQSVEQASAEGARLVVFPELMLTGHGAHRLMTDNAEPVPDGPLSRAIIDLSARHSVCICVGIAELEYGIVYNSQIVADKGRYLGCQRKIHASGDEYVHFAPGRAVPVFDIGELRFGITVCYDSRFPELSLIHSLNHVDAVVSVHAARSGVWPEEPDRAFARAKIAERQESWLRRWSGRADAYNFFVLLCNAVGPSTAGLDGVVANHAGSIMAIDPRGNAFVTTEREEFESEIRTIEIDPDDRVRNHPPTRNRRLDIFQEALTTALKRHARGGELG